MKLAQILKRRAAKEAATTQEVKQAYRDLVLALATDQDPAKLNSHLGSDEIVDKLLERLEITGEQLKADVQRAEGCQTKLQAERSLPELESDLSKATMELAKRQAALDKLIAEHQEKMNPIRADRGALDYAVGKAKDKARKQIDHEDYPADFVAKLAQIAGLRQSAGRPMTRLHSEIMAIDRKVLGLESELEATTIEAEKEQLTQALADAKATQSGLLETQADWQSRQAAWTAADDESRGMICPETGLFLATKTADKVFVKVNFSPLRLPLDLDK